ncbi:MAG TPA: hypothetical protein VEL08_00370 [Chthoniobacterales bacterium]|nr:hypothetical protein [Chthoniobacterales bacterium]
MIGITFALPSESSGLVRRLRAVQRHGKLLSGRIDSRDVTILHTGVGARDCNERLEILLHKTRPSLVISSGFAGAVGKDLQVGNLILAENFSDRQLLASAERILRDRKPRAVKLFTSTSIVDSVSERNEITRVAGAAAVDMETGAIVGVCNAHGVPLLSFRAISDTPGEPFPAPPSILFDIKRQRTNYARLASYLVQEPPSLLRLFRFARKIKRVRATLTEAIIALIRQL